MRKPILFSAEGRPWQYRWSWLAIARYVKKDGHPASNNYKGNCVIAIEILQILWYCLGEANLYSWRPRNPTAFKWELRLFVASAKRALSLKIDISRQTGLRPIEVQGEKGLRVKDIHPDQNTITSLSTKGCNPRPPMKISEELTARLKLHTNPSTGNDDLLFSGLSNHTEKVLEIRNRLARKLNDSSLRTIRYMI